MRSYSASKVVSRLLSILVLSGMLFGFVDSSRSAIWAQEADEGKIAYIGQDNNIWLVNAHGSEPRQITFDAIPGSNQWEATVGYSEIRWSPDGRVLGFSREDRGKLSILAMQVSDSTVAPVVSSDVYGGQGFDWLPDSRSIVFSDASGGLSLLNLDTGAVTSLIRPDPDSHLTRPDWAPVGDHVFFSIPSYIGGEMVWLDNLHLAEAPGDSYIDVREGFVGCDWSPEGQRLVCCTHGFYGGCSFYTLLSASGTQVGTILETFEGLSVSPIWSPNGKSIAYGDEVSLTTYIAEMEGNEVIRVSTLVEGDYFYYDPLDWSPDGSRLLALSPDDSVVIIDIATSNVTEIAVASAAASRSGPARHLVAAWQPAIQEAGLDLGFRPNPNGYHFQNDQFLRTQEMFEQFFGTENVRHPDGSWCEAAKQFFWGTHPDMPQPWKGKGYRNVADGWSCLGFSLSSLLSYLDQPQPQAGPFAIAHYEQLYRHTEPDQFTASIAYYSGVQTGKQYVDAFRARMDHCDTDPNRKIDDIEEGILNREPVIVLLNTFTEHGYHALVPYRVESVSSTETNIYVYDSEAPGEEHVIHFAHSGDEWHWTYTFVGSIAKAAGTATGRCEDIFLYPIRTSVEQGDPPVVFCESQSATSGVKALQRSDRSHRVLAQLPAEGDWVMRDNLGRRLGWVNGVLVSEIPDAFYVPQALGDVSLSYRILYLPEGEYTVELTDSPTDEFGYTLFGDGRFIEVAGHLRSPGSGVGLSITPGLDQARLFETQNLTSFTLTLDSERITESRVATVAGASLTGNGDLSVGFDGDQLMVSRGGGNLHYSPGLEKSDGQHFASEPLTLEGNETHTVTPIDWSELGSANVVWEVDDDSDGTIDETLVLEDQASVPMPTPTATVSPENDKGKGPCPGSLAMIGLVGLATLIGLTRQSPQSWRRR